MVTEKKYCEQCSLPLFRYALKHNGVDTVVWRCMKPHGIIDTVGRTRTIKGKRVKRGIAKNFSSLLNIRK